MKRILGIVVAIFIGASGMACGGADCDALAQAALACKYSGITTQQKADDLRETCEQGSRGAGCVTDAYNNNCTSSSALLAALMKCQ